MKRNGNHMNGKKLLAGSAVLVVGALVLSACAGGGSDSGSADGDVTMTFWHNSTTGPGKAFWDDTVAAFEEANPGVTIEIQSIQNEDMDGKLQTALNSGDAPDIFMARGGGKIADVVAAGQVMDLTERHHRRDRVRPRRRAVGVRDRRQGLRRARRRAARRHLLQPGPLRRGRHHRAARHDRRARGRGRGAQGHRASRRSPSARRTPGRPRTGTTSSRCAPARRRRWTKRPTAASSTTRAGSKPARTCRRSPRPSRSTTASSRPPPSRAPARPPVCSPTTRPPWSSWAPGTPASSPR